MTSLFFVGLYGLLVTALAFRVSMTRRRTQVLLGDGGNKELIAAQRAHMNALEHSMVVLLLLISLDLSEWNSAMIQAAGWLFFLTRLSHASGFILRKPFLAFIAALTTYILEIALSIVLMYLHF